MDIRGKNWGILDNRRKFFGGFWTFVVKIGGFLVSLKKKLGDLRFFEEKIWGFWIFEEKIGGFWTLKNWGQIGLTPRSRTKLGVEKIF